MTEHHPGRFVPELFAADHARPAGVRITRAAVPLPDEGRAALAAQRGAAPAVGVYRAAASPADALENARWYPVILRRRQPGAEAVIGPTVRTALPAGMSVALVVTLGTAATTLGTLGAVGVALGSVVTALVARTQYTLERDQYALSGLWLAQDLSHVCVARYDSLPARLAGRARWYLVPLAQLAPEARRARARGYDPFFREARRAAAITRVLRALAVDGASIDPLEAERIYTLARLAGFRRGRRGSTDPEERAAGVIGDPARDATRERP